MITPMLAGLLLLAGAGPSQPDAASVSAGKPTYEAFMAEPLAARHGIFGRLAPEDQARLMRTHVERWLAKNRAILTSEQIAAAKEAAAALTPALYADAKQSESVPLVKALEEKLAKLFTPEQFKQAFSLNGQYVPPAMDK